MNKEDLQKALDVLDQHKAQEVIRWALKEFGSKNVALATSFGAEDQVITDMLSGIDSKTGVFTLDTGRLPEQTHDVMERTRSRYGISIEVLCPQQDDLQKMLASHGPDQFLRSVDLRKECCHVRKMIPLRKKLVTLKAWICGLRREQSLTRVHVNKVEWDEVNGLFKINPLADWTEKELWAYIRENDIPYNQLHDQGYPSIGCAPCTRAVNPGEDVRAGRWWWENPEHKECGLHRKAV